MKVVSLNTWGGKAGTEGLLSFFKAHKDIDVFCLQEVFNGGEEFLGSKSGRFTLDSFDHKLLERICAVLPEHIPYFRPHFSGIFGLVTFVRKDVPVQGEGETSIYQESGYYSKENIADHARILQHVEFANPDCAVLQVHGLWNGNGKLDSEDRLRQSERILAFTQTLTTPYVLVGDFNLRPDTESIRLLEKAGLRNLVTEYNIPSTRTSLYDSRDKEPHANYVFVSKDINVHDFRILPDEVSDHAPLYLEFALV